MEILLSIDHVDPALLWKFGHPVDRKRRTWWDVRGAIQKKQGGRDRQ